MNEPNGSKKIRSVSINLGGTQARIEEVFTADSAAGKVRFSCQSKEPVHAQSLVLSERELVDLLQKAVRAGILSQDFIKDLSSEFEI
jgi:hypothetical protein